MYFLDRPNDTTITNNHFNTEFLKWNLPSLNLYRNNYPNRCLSQTHSRITNKAGPDETVHYDSFHLDLRGIDNLLGW